MLRQGGARPNFRYIRSVMRSRHLGSARPVRVRSAARHAPRAGGRAVAPGPRPRRRGEVSRDTTPEPPPWVKVPVEHLDASGQAVDPEGERVLNDALKTR